MSTPSREEFDAKLRAVEAGTERRLVSIEKSIENGFAKSQAEMQKEISSQTKWITGLVATIVSVGIALSTYINSMNKAPQALPAPTVVVVPATVAGPTAKP